MLRQARSVNSSLPFDGRSNLDQRDDLTSDTERRKAVWEDFARDVAGISVGVKENVSLKFQRLNGWLGTSSALVYFT